MSLRRGMAAALLLLLLLGLCACPPRPAPTPAAGVLLLPLINAVDPAAPGPERALAFDALQLLLPEVDGLTPLDLNASLACRPRPGAIELNPLDPAGLAELGRSCGADYVIAGSYRSELNRLSLNLLLVSAADGRQQRVEPAGFLDDIHLICADAALALARFSGRDPSRALWDLVQQRDPLLTPAPQLPAMLDQLLRSGRDSELITLCDRTLTQDPQSLPALTALARVALRNGDLELAGQLVQAGLELAEHRDDRAARADLLLIGGQTMALGNDREAAEMLLFNSLDLATQLNDQGLQARALCAMADLYARDGRLQRAREINGRALKLLDGSDQQRLIGDAQLNLAAIEIEAGDPGRARSRLRLADRAYELSGDGRSRALAAKISGDMRREAGDAPAALADYRRARNLALQYPNLLLLAHLYNDSGALLIQLDRPAEAAWELGAAEGLAHTLGLGELAEVARQGRLNAESRIR